MSASKRTTLLSFAWLLLLLGLSGCVTLDDPEVSQEYRSDVVAALQPGQSGGQTFIARRPHPNGITLWLRPASDSASSDGSSARVVFELLRAPDSTTTLASYTIAASDIQSGSPLTFPFPAQPGPAGQDYYFRVRAEGLGLNLLGRNEDAYPGGQATLEGELLPADLAFRLAYDWEPAAALADLASMVRRSGLFVLLALCCWVPGRLLLSLTHADTGLDWGERTALSTALSLSAIPLLMTWTSLFGLIWSRPAVWAVAILLTGLLLIRLGPDWFRNLREATSSWVAMRRSFPITSALAAVFLASLFLRLVMARDLAAPPWVDPVHHGLITRLILAGGRFPEAYTPFVEIETANYHAGFHSSLAVFTWLSGLDLIDSMLFFGQAINALAVLAVYPFTTALTQSRPAGLIAVLLAGIFSPMPAYYLSWGRYTQLAGLVILPAAFFLLVRPLTSVPAQEPRPRWITAGLPAAIAAGGLFLTHYRVTAFIALLLAVYLLVAWAAGRIRPERSFSFTRAGLHLALAALLAIALSLPWWPSTLATFFLPKLSLTTSGQARPFADFSWNLLLYGYGRYLLALSGLGLAWALFRRRSFPLVIALWVALLFLLANTNALLPGIPGVGLVNNTSVEISLYLPICALAGYLLAWVLWGWRRLLPNRLRPLYALAASLGVGVLALLGARSLIPILNPTTILVRQADRPALAWAEENLPAGAVAAINPFRWGYGLYAGQDGGYWLAPAAGVPTLPPPVLAGFTDVPARTKQTTEAVEEVLDLAGDPQALHDFLLANGITHVYVGGRGGALSPQKLSESGWFTPVYQQDGVWIFALRQPSS